MPDRLPAIAIEEFTPADTDGVIDLILPIQREEFGVAVSAADQPDLRNVRNFYQSGTGGFWVAKSAGRIVGTIGLRDMGGGQAALRKMFVAAEFRGRGHGVAAALLDRLLSHAAGKGIGAIYLGTTDKFVAAHRFYEKHGFTEVDKSALPPSFPLMAVDTKFYVRKLSG